MMFVFDLETDTRSRAVKYRAMQIDKNHLANSSVASAPPAAYLLENHRRTDVRG